MSRDNAYSFCLLARCIYDAFDGGVVAKASLLGGGHETAVGGDARIGVEFQYVWNAVARHAKIQPRITGATEQLPSPFGYVDQLSQ